MKKFYALAAALLATGSMMAVNPATDIMAPAAGQQAQMTAEGQAMARAEQAFNEYVAANEISIPGAQKFTWNDGSTTWEATMMENGQWSDYFTSWDGLIYYNRVSVILQNQYTSTSDRKYINYIMFYPRYTMWKKEYRAQLFPEYQDKDSLNSVPLKYWDVADGALLANWKGFAVPQASETANSFYLGQTTIGGDKYLVIGNNTTPYSGGGYYFANTTSFGYGIYNGTRCGFPQGAKLEVSNFDDETSSINLHFSGTAINASGNQIWTYDYNYSGEALMPGFAQKPMEWTATNMHIINMGSVSGEDEEYEAIDDTEWGPFQRFQVLACSEGYTFDNVELTSGNKMWTSTTWPTTPARMTSDAPSMCYLRGALFSADGTAEPFGEWQVSDVQVGFDNTNFPITTGTPGVNTFLYGNVNENYWPWGPDNGMYSVYQGFYWWLPNNSTNGASYNPFVMNGTTVGFGYKGLSTYNALYTVGYKGTITYHYDPTDYLKTREINSIGSLEPNTNWEAVNTIFADGENNMNVVAANGIINVTVDNDALVGIYNMAGMIVKTVNAKAGQTVSVDVANGIYIVKVANKAVKVAL